MRAGFCSSRIGRHKVSPTRGLWNGRARHALEVSAFPKCYIDQIAGSRTMSVFDWIEMARSLDADGLEMYDGFLRQSRPILPRPGRRGDPRGRLRHADALLLARFHQPRPRRAEAGRRPRGGIDPRRRVGWAGRGAVCRVLSGQRYPEVSREQGLEWVVDCISQVLPVAREHDVVLGLENHYKDGFWKYPEFAQKMDVFLELVDAIPDREHFGVQYDPSNAIVAGDDPIELLRAVADRVVSMHASDRYLAEGATLERTAPDRWHARLFAQPAARRDRQGTERLRCDFPHPGRARYQGWVSIEDGMNGMEEMAESLAFLRRMSARYFPE